MFFAFVSVVLNALAQITIKSLSGLELSFGTIIRSWQLYATGILYATSILTWFLALRILPLNIAYPLQAFGYVIVTILAWFIFQESTSALQITALLIIVAGVSLLSLSSTK
jgi:undecaprenyl phosphate-alpha-L-ara4N flippase subunit ArnE